MNPVLAILTSLALAAPCTATEVREGKPDRITRSVSANDSLDFAGARMEIYKKAGDASLALHIFEPPGHSPGDRRPAIVFFFGGGWRDGTPRQFEPHCRHLASLGMVAVAADYRVLSRHGTPAVKCVEDGKSAIRWVRANADRLGIDPNRIAAGGGSAGGHVAACTALLKEFDAPDEDPAISSRPDALVLFNPALVLAWMKRDEAPVRTTGENDLKARMGVDPEKLSPTHHVREGAPPTLVLHGKADKTVPYWTAEAFHNAMRKAGNRCELIGYDGQPHSFFNYRNGANPVYSDTVRAMDRFLASLGYIEEPTHGNDHLTVEENDDRP